ncbi:hypothetical protein AB3662_26665 [Sorangium cellulosum]|uniref:hypothetical protein n=1 Tax=Sorangium cellulosum TaxID=56 RepID=UPI003D9A23A5
MTRFISTLGVLVPLLLTACDVTFIDGGTNDGGATDPDDPSGEDGSAGHAGCGGSDGGAVPGEPLPAIALTRAQQDVLWDEYWASQDDVGAGSTGSGDVALDPNDLFLRVSDLGESCGAPMARLTCGGHWEMRLVLPSAYQRVGVYDLEDPGLMYYSGMSVTGEPHAPGSDECGGGGGSIGPGTLEILAIDEAEVRFRVTFNGFWDVDPSGEYTAPRCP